MEALAASLKKRQETSGGFQQKAKRKKFMSRRELQEQKERAIKESNTTSESADQNSNKGDNPSNSQTTSTDSSAQPTSNIAEQKRATVDTGANKNGKSAPTLLPKQVIQRLRALGQPITLFGEDDDGRRVRLKACEKANLAFDHSEDHALQGSHVRKTFKGDKAGAGEEDEDEDDLDAASEDEGEGKEVNRRDPSGPQKGGDGRADNDNDVEEHVSRPPSPEREIREWVKMMLGEWGKYLAKRSEEDKRTGSGKRETMMFKQCKDYIRPFQKLLKKKTAPYETVVHVHHIVKLCKDRQYMQACDWYVKLAIGNAPWPIGVTMVGIHARTGREKIEASKVAHVMNDELQRKYITSLKRLMTFAQEVFPTDPSRMMLV